MQKSQKTAGDYEREFAEHSGASDLAAAEVEDLRRAEGAAARAGIEALQKHRKKLEDASLRHTVESALADEARQQCDRALREEENTSKRTRYQRAAVLVEQVQAQISERYPVLCGELVDLLTRERDADAAVLEVNLNLPDGLPPMRTVEARLRHELAVADVYGDVEVERPSPIEGGAVVRFSLGEPPPQRGVRTVIERRVVKPGSRAYSPKPLYDCFIAPALKRDEPLFAVAKSRSRLWWND